LIPIYQDRHFKQALADDFIWEGHEYFLDLSAFGELDRQTVIEGSRLEAFSQFDPRNPVCSFIVSGYLGTINVGGRNLDIRSKKFAIDGPGDAQFAALMEDIDRARNGLIFHYQSPTTRQGAEESRAHTPSALERLNFFLPFIDGPDLASSIAGTVNRIVRNPHHKVLNYRERSTIEGAKRIDVAAFVKQFGREELLRARGESLAAARRLTKTDFLPRWVPTHVSKISFDTAENRFVRFILEDIEAVALAVLRGKGIPALARRDANILLDRVRTLLSEPFFREIGKLQHVPIHSPVLTGNEGYSRLYRYYLRSRLGVVDPLTTARQQLRDSPLKDVASLYEVWVFFRLAELFFDKSKSVSVSSFGGDGLPYGTTWSCDDTSLSYNLTYQSRRGSYSTSLRPDVSLRIGERLWLFDAKYKADHSALPDDENGASISATVKKIDLQKMHTYVDAISTAQAAIAVYPGNETALFARKRESEDDLLNLKKFGGIGGMPLLPLGDGDEFKLLRAALVPDV
jgi:hypothetical protein